ncbi:MAG TPA: NAD(P)/FAD-dependent oxidoreductase [Chitinophagaceae bacterium]|nr:NAD(P)/FAD-dependent oxidoreductase [Chitinophagaceae bacterium]
MEKRSIIIVGGGIAGLVAARELADEYEITLLEANDRLGGRICSLTPDGFGQVIEGGPEFIHGRLKNTIRLLDEAGIEYVKTTGRMLRKKAGKWKEQDEMMEGWDDLLKQMKKLDHDTTMYDFLQQYFGGEKYTEFRRHVTAYAEGFDIADVRKASVKALYSEWSQEDGNNYRLPSGYGQLVEYLRKECISKGCVLLTGKLVKQLDWEEGEVTVLTDNEEKYTADKAIVTIPIPLLQEVSALASINFTPPLDEYVNAARNIGMGTVIKFLLKFKKAFWPADAAFILSDEAVPTWWTLLPDTSPVLTGWLSGPKAELVTGEKDEVLLEKALLSLASIFEMTPGEIKEQLVASAIFNWKTNEYAHGAYSYATPASHAARKILTTPVAGSLYFSGEGLYEGAALGTVEAAISQAKATASLIRGG